MKTPRDGPPLGLYHNALTRTLCQNPACMSHPLAHLKDHDPDYYPDPEVFDVTRSFDPDVLFGYGPRYSIGAALANRQLYLTLPELFRRFPDVTLAEEPERDENDHNAIVFKRLMLHTHL